MARYNAVYFWGKIGIGNLRKINIGGLKYQRYLWPTATTYLPKENSFQMRCYCISNINGRAFREDFQVLPPRDCFIKLGGGEDCWNRFIMLPRWSIKTWNVFSIQKNRVALPESWLPTFFHRVEYYLLAEVDDFLKTLWLMSSIYGSNWKGKVRQY